MEDKIGTLTYELVTNILKVIRNFPKLYLKSTNPVRKILP